MCNTICDIQSIQVTGMNLGSQMLPRTLEVMARIDCYAVNIAIRRNANEAPFAWMNGIPSIPDIQAVTGRPQMHVVQEFNLDPAVEGIQCGDFLHVTVSCAEDANCQSTALVPVYCKDACPISIRITADPPFNQAAGCISPGTYTVSVLEPLGPNISYSWSLMPVGQPETVMPDTGPSLSVAVPSGNPRMFLTVTATQSNCQPLLGVLVFPPATC